MRGRRILIGRNEVSIRFANIRLKRLVSYLPDGDSVFMEIKSYGENEEIRIKNENGKVIFFNSNPEIDIKVRILEYLKCFIWNIV